MDPLEPQVDLGDNAKVAVRFRPISEQELANGAREVCVPINGKEVGLREEVGNRLDVKRLYKFDHVFDCATTNNEVYAKIGQPIVHNVVLGGLNSTIFAYGVTSSGKTHTMMGTPEQPGIVPQALQDVLQQVETRADRLFVITLAMMEVYNEEVYDLLNPDPNRPSLRLRRAVDNTFFPEGLIQQRVQSVAEARALVDAGNGRRRVGRTNMNEASSRAHTIIRLSVEVLDDPAVVSAAVRLRDTAAAPPVGRTSYLHMIDLAGSESANAGGDPQEGSKIRTSLMHLGEVIRDRVMGGALGASFNNSKLTKLMRGCLTGHGSCMAVICNVSPAEGQTTETKRSLEFANKVKQLQFAAPPEPKLSIQELIWQKDQEIAQLTQEVEELKELIRGADVAAGALPGGAATTSTAIAEPAVRVEENEGRKDNVQFLQYDLAGLKEEIERVQENGHGQVSDAQLLELVAILGDAIAAARSSVVQRYVRRMGLKKDPTVVPWCTNDSIGRSLEPAPQTPGRD